jgi:hypothetical protein
MNINFCLKLPNLVQHIILEFLDYKLRSGKYIKQLPKDLPIYELILNRQKVKEIYYSYEDWYNNENIYYIEDENGIFYYFDQYGNETYFMISIIIEYIKRKNWIENTLEIKYSYHDRNIFKIECHKYDYDFDGSKHEVE